jgi:hypothetical protein
MLKNAIAIPAGLVAVVSFRVYVSACLFSVAVVSSLRGAPFLELVMPFTGPEAKKIRRNIVRHRRRTTLHASPRSVSTRTRAVLRV